MTNRFEQPSEKQEGDRKAKAKTLQALCEKVCGYFDFYDTFYIQLMENTKQGYSKKEWDAVDDAISRLPEVIHEELKNPTVELAGDGNIVHVLGNSPLLLQTRVEKTISKKIEALKQERPHAIPENDSQIIRFPEAPAIKDDDERYIQYWIKKLRLTPEEEAVFVSFRNLRDYLLYYLDFIEQPENREILHAEMRSADGWLRDLERYYKPSTNPDVPIRRIPSDSESRLKHINFFARLEGFDSKLSGKINSLKNISAPIDETNFEAEFEKLKDKEYLNREAIYKDFIGRAKLKVA
ncbi:MAG: hypothetical protein ACOYS2_00190 [Patescibacteria group bacterium]